MRAAILTMTLACVAPTDASAASIAAHAIDYDLALAQLEHGDTVDATGHMSFRIDDQCDSWTTQQRLQMQTVTRGGDVQNTVTDYATLETKDGRHMAFETVQKLDDQVQSRVEGEADRRADGRVAVRYKLPAARTILLPAGTLFPLAHTMAIVDAARLHKESIAPRLFDGTSPDDAFDTYVTLEGWSARNADAPARSLQAMGAAQTHVAFFATGPAVMTPDFEMAARYFENGVSDRLWMNFGDFAMRGTVAKFILLPVPRCSSRKHL